MNNNNKKMFSYAQLIQQLKNFCMDKRSGTMLIISNDHHSIRLVLKNGIIISCAFTMTQGKDALPLIRQIHSGSFTFVDGGFTGGMNVNESPLPDTTTIFNMLEGNDSSANTNVSPQTSLNSTNTENLKPLIENIEKKLSQFIGPMAEYICEEYIEDMGIPSNMPEIGAFINTVALEIDDSNKRKQFTKESSTLMH